MRKSQKSELLMTVFNTKGYFRIFADKAMAYSLEKLNCLVGTLKALQGTENSLFLEVHAEKCVKFCKTNCHYMHYLTDIIGFNRHIWLVLYL